MTTVLQYFAVLWYYNTGPGDVQQCFSGQMEAAAVALQHPRAHDTCIAVLLADAQRPCNLHASLGATKSQSISLQRLSGASERDIRVHLSSFSPHLVQPAALAQTASLPRLPSGKYDRLAISQLQEWQHMLCGSESNPNLNSAEVPRPPSGHRHSELSIMHACTSVLAGTRADLALEPTTNLLEAGVNSIQVAALAAMLGCDANTVFLHRTPRALARALSGGSCSHHDAESSVSLRNGAAAAWQREPKTHTETSSMQSEASLPHRKLKEAAVRMHATEGSVPAGTDVAVAEVQGCGKAVEFESSHAEYGGRGADSAKVLVSDSRGEHAVHWISRHHLPAGRVSVGTPAPLVGKTQQEQQQQQYMKPRGDSQHGTVVLGTMNACIDAPLTCIRLLESPRGCGVNNSPDGTCTEGAPSEMMHGGTQWLLVCSHACDVACILLHAALDPGPVRSSVAHAHEEAQCVQRRASEVCDVGGSNSNSNLNSNLNYHGLPYESSTQSLWTATVGSSPDAGLQVTACGRCAAVACISGVLELLRLKTGERLACVDTCGQLRRWALHTPCLNVRLAVHRCVLCGSCGSCSCAVL